MADEAREKHKAHRIEATSRNVTPSCYGSWKLFVDRRASAEENANGRSRRRGAAKKREKGRRRFQKGVKHPRSLFPCVSPIRCNLIGYEIKSTKFGQKCSGQARRLCCCSRRALIWNLYFTSRVGRIVEDSSLALFAFHPSFPVISLSFWCVSFSLARIVAKHAHNCATAAFTQEPLWSSYWLRVRRPFLPRATSFDRGHLRCIPYTIYLYLSCIQHMKELPAAFSR